MPRYKSVVPAHYDKCARYSHLQRIEQSQTVDNAVTVTFNSAQLEWQVYTRASATRVICHSRRLSCTPLCESTGITHFPSCGSNAGACCSNDSGESRECTHRLDLVKCRSGIWKERPPCSLIPTSFSRAAADRWGVPPWHLNRRRQDDASTIVATRRKICTFFSLLPYSLARGSKPLFIATRDFLRQLYKFLC